MAARLISGPSRDGLLRRQEPTKEPAPFVWFEKHAAGACHRQSIISGGELFCVNGAMRRHNYRSFRLSADAPQGNIPPARFVFMYTIVIRTELPTRRFAGWGERLSGSAFPDGSVELSQELSLGPVCQDGEELEIYFIAAKARVDVAWPQALCFRGQPAGEFLGGYPKL